MNENMSRPMDDDALALLGALQKCRPEKMSSFEIVEQGLVFDEEGVFQYARELMKAGEPVCVSSGLAGEWEGLAAQEFEIWLSVDLKELKEMGDNVDEHIAEMVAIRSGLVEAARRAINE
jgi:hypothetical protein